MQNTGRAGFTIVELLIVIVIIAVLAAITTVAYNGLQQRAVQSALSSQLANVSRLVKLEQAKTGQLPTSLAALNDGAGVPVTGDITLAYTADIAANTFCMTGIHKETTVYRTTESGALTAGGCNAIQGAAVTGSMGGTTLTRITDGLTASSGYHDGGTGTAWVMVDLGVARTVSYVTVWHYYADGRRYNNVKTEVSADGTNWTVVYDGATEGAYVETSAGKISTFAPTSVRYIRDTISGNSVNAYNHWVEIQAS